MSILKSAEEEFQNWAKGKSWKEIFSCCPKGEWLLWIFQRTNPEDIQVLSLVKGHCANTIRFFMRNERDRTNVDVGINFGKGKATIPELSSLTIEAAKRVSYFDSKFDKIEKGYNYDFNSELYLNTNLYEVSMDCKNQDISSNVLDFQITEIGRIATNIHAQASLIPYYTGECIFEIISEKGPFELIDDWTKSDPQNPSKIASYKLMYSNYVKNSTSADINDIADIAKQKNQLDTANICRKYLPFEIWNIG